MEPVKAYPTLQSRIRVFCGVVLKDVPFFFPPSTNPCLPKRYDCQPCMQLPSASSDFSNTHNSVGSNAVGEKKWRRLAARLASCTNSSTRNVTFRMTTTTYTPCPLWRTCLSYIVEWASPSQERRQGGLLTSNPTLRGRDGHARGPGGRRPLRLRQGVGADELQRRPTHSMQAGLTALMRLPDPARPRSLTKGHPAQYRPVPALHPVPLLAPGKGRPTMCAAGRCCWSSPPLFVFPQRNPEHPLFFTWLFCLKPWITMRKEEFTVWTFQSNLPVTPFRILSLSLEPWQWAYLWGPPILSFLAHHLSFTNCVYSYRDWEARHLQEARNHRTEFHSSPDRVRSGKKLLLHFSL